MMHLKTIEFIFRLLSFIVAYLVVITIPAAIRSRVAAYFGDDTSEQFGLSSFNPLHHIDFLGAAILLMSSVSGSFLGWGRNVLNNPFNISGNHKLWKICVIYYTDVLVHFFMAFVGLVFFVFTFGPHINDFASFLAIDQNAPSVVPNIAGLIDLMILKRYMTHILLAKAFPHVSAFNIVLGFIAIAAVYLHTVLGVLYAILNSREFYIICSLDEYDSSEYENIRTGASSFFIPLILIFLFADPLRETLVYAITYSAIKVGQYLF